MSRGYCTIDSAYLGLHPLALGVICRSPLSVSILMCKMDITPPPSGSCSEGAVR